MHTFFSQRQILSAAFFYADFLEKRCDFLMCLVLTSPITQLIMITMIVSDECRDNIIWNSDLIDFGLNDSVIKTKIIEHLGTLLYPSSLFISRTMLELIVFGWCRFALCMLNRNDRSFGRTGGECAVNLKTSLHLFN